MGVRFISIVDHADTDDAYNKRARQINGLNNEWYCEDTSLNVRRILRHKRENGQFTGSFAAYGYLVDPADKHHLIIDPKTAPVVKDIFMRYLSGQGYKKIVSALNDAGIPNPTLYKHTNDSKYVNKNADKSPDSGLWTLSTIASILHNEVYMGTLAQGRTHFVSYKNHHRLKVPKDEWIRTFNAHEAIIDISTWYAVQELLRSKSHRGSTVTGETPALSGKVKCAICGRPMKRNTYYNKPHTKRYYNLRCASFQKGTDCCPNCSAMSGLELEQQLVEAINAHVAEYCDMDQLEIADRVMEQIENSRKAIADIDEHIAKRQSFISRTYEDRLEGRISPEDYELYTAKFRSEIDKLKEERDKQSAHIDNLRSSLMTSENKAQQLAGFCKIDKLDFEVVNEFISNVCIGAKEPDGTREIKIDWNI